jgi:hypothetical protein
MRCGTGTHEVVVLQGTARPCAAHGMEQRVDVLDYC